MSRCFLILHGYAGSGPDHWQTWLAGRLRGAGETVAYPDLPDPFAPTLPEWRAALGDALRALPAEPTVVAHSLSCVLWLHHCAAPVADVRAARVLLVAPPCEAGAPESIHPFFPVPLVPAAVVAATLQDTRLVYAADDPYCPGDAAALYGAPLCLPVDELEGAGHINPETGYGPWPEVEAWCYGASAITSSRIAPG